MARTFKSAVHGECEGSLSALFARRTRTMKQCSFDARSQGQNLGRSLNERRKRFEGPSLGLMARLGVPVGGRVRK
jgi:hypothetical protein